MWKLGKIKHVVFYVNCDRQHLFVCVCVFGYLTDLIVNYKHS